MPPDLPTGEVPELREKLVRYNRETKRFLEILVHDIRAHQRGINTSSEVLANELGDQLGEATTQVLTQLQEEVARMNVLLAAVSNYSDTMPGARYSMRAIPLEVPIQSACSELATIIRETNATVAFGALPQVYGDPTRLALVFRQMISNAINYRSAAAPRIHIQAVPNPDQWVVSVEDNGIGIAREYWERLFAPFFRLHGAELPGTGLGLAACRNIVEAHGGTIWLASKVCEGTTFFFTLPTTGN
jgi:light-regulated signal transduction histidine kinase (bacteriophytochrome)